MLSHSNYDHGPTLTFKKGGSFDGSNQRRYSTKYWKS